MSGDVVRWTTTKTNAHASCPSCCQACARASRGRVYNFLRLDTKPFNVYDHLSNKRERARVQHSSTLQHAKLQVTRYINVCGARARPTTHSFLSFFFPTAIKIQTPKPTRSAHECTIFAHPGLRAVRRRRDKELLIARLSN